METTLERMLERGYMLQEQAASQRAEESGRERVWRETRMSNSRHKPGVKKKEGLHSRRSPMKPNRS